MKPKDVDMGIIENQLTKQVRLSKFLSLDQQNSQAGSLDDKGQKIFVWNFNFFPKEQAFTTNFSKFRGGVFDQLDKQTTGSPAQEDHSEHRSPKHKKSSSETMTKDIFGFLGETE